MKRPCKSFPDSYRDANRTIKIQKLNQIPMQPGVLPITIGSNWKDKYFLTALLFIISLLFVAACNSNTTPENKGTLPTSLVNNPRSANGMDTVAAARKPTMDFKDTVHNFGPMHKDETVQYDFEFTNNGKTPLIITSATGSCGCTVADYPRDPLPAGKSAVMKVSFNSTGKKGHQEKTVTINTNTLRNIHMLFIKADVEPKK